MPDTYSVSYITHTMRGAPQIKGNTPGGLIDVLDCVLVTGWGLAAPTSVTVASGTATATFSGSTPWEIGAVIEITGGTPAGLAGRSRVASVVGSTMTFATAAADGTYTGSIGIKYAPAGWEKAFTGTNKAAYRSKDVTGARFYLCVDDSNGLFARVRGYEAMSDIDTGTGMFPLDSQISGGWYWHKATSSNATAIPYLLAADAKQVLQAIAYGVSGGAAYENTGVFGFGEGVHLNPAGDAFATVLSGSASSNSSLQYGALSGAKSDSNGSYGGAVFARGWQGLGGSIFARPVPEGGDSTVFSGADNTLGAAPSPIDGSVKMVRMLLKEQGTPGLLRSVTPGCYFVPQKLDNTLYAAQFALHDGGGALAGRKFAAIFLGNGSYGDSRFGTAFVDVTGPWR